MIYTFNPYWLLVEAIGCGGAVWFVFRLLDTHEHQRDANPHSTASVTKRGVVAN